MYLNPNVFGFKPVQAEKKHQQQKNCFWILFLHSADIVLIFITQIQTTLKPTETWSKIVHFNI